MATWRPVLLNNYSTFLATPMAFGTPTMTVVHPLLPLRRGECYYLTLYTLNGMVESEWEIVRVVHVSPSGLDLVVERGVEGTTQREHQPGAKIEMRLTAGHMNELYCRTRKLKMAQMLGL